MKITKSDTLSIFTVPLVFIVVILAARYYYGHLLFHTLAELFTVFVGTAMAIVSYYTYHFTKNNFLLYLGSGYFWIAILDTFHMLTYKGIDLYTIENSNVTLTFWIFTRFFEVFIIASAPFIKFKTLSKEKIFILFGAIAAAIHIFAFSSYAPNLFEEGVGLTPLKITSEYIIILLLISVLFIYKKNKKEFNLSVYKYMIFSIFFTIFAEISFTLYSDVYGVMSTIGHIFKFLSYWMIFLAVIRTTLQEPFSVMAHKTSTYDTLPIPSIVVDMDDKICQINKVTQKFLNLSHRDIISNSNHNLFHNNSIDKEECKVCKAIRDGKELLSFEVQREEKTYSISLTPIVVKNELNGSVQVSIDISRQKQAEYELQNETSLMKTIIDTVPIRIFWKDKESKFLGCNQLLAKDANVNSPQDIIGKSDYDMPWKNEADLYVADDKTVMQFKHSQIDQEEPQTQSDGSVNWLSTSKAPLLDENGDVYGTVGAYFNITESREAKNKLQTTNKMLSNAERIGNFGSIEFNLNSDEVSWSDEVYRIHGEDISSFIPEKDIFLSYMSENDQTTISNALELVAIGATSLPFSYMLNRKDGTIRNILFRSEPVFSSSGDVTKIIGIISDQTEEVVAQQELKKLKTVVEQSPVSIVVTDILGNLEYVNPQFTKVTGYTAEEVIGKNPHILSSGKTTDEEYAYLWDKVKNNNTWSGTFKNVKKSGEFYWESAIISPIKDKSGKIVNYIGIKQDITEQVMLQDKLSNQEELMLAQSRQAAMGEMIGMIAHQWRQPLSIISMGANNLLLDIEMNNIQSNIFKEEATDIVTQVAHLSKTIDDFRDYFRPDKEKEKIIVNEVIYETINIIGKSLEYNNIELELNLLSTSTVKIFTRELIQVLINILNNAKESIISHHTKDKKITITSKESSDTVIIEIVDNGEGIKPELLQKIFEPYFSTKNKQTGTGLGLYMSKTIMTQHLGGDIKAINNDSDGACFILTLKKENS